MSSMRNAVQRRNHKERAQPKQREKWGLLEKHKDYSLRAKDFNEKKRRLKLLRQKAADRNPDEFHFAMMSSKTDERGVKIADRGNQALSVDAVALLKTQDAGYLRTMVQKTKKAIERLEQALTFTKPNDGDVALRLAETEESMIPGRVAFVETADEQESWIDDRKVLSKALADRLQQNPLGEEINLDSNETKSKQFSRPKQKSTKQTEEAARIAKANQRRRRRNLEIRQTTLAILRRRERDLRSAEVALVIQRSRMTGGHGIGVTKTGVKFKNTVRKR